jgi:hypothetical protein
LVEDSAEAVGAEGSAAEGSAASAAAAAAEAERQGDGRGLRLEAWGLRLEA